MKAAAFGLLALSFSICGAQVPGDIAKDVVSFQREAVRRFPALSDEHSELHAKFIRLYAEKKAAADAMLQSNDWPVRIAEEAAATAGSAPISPPAFPEGATKAQRDAIIAQRIHDAQVERFKADPNKNAFSGWASASVPGHTMLDRGPYDSSAPRNESPFQTLTAGEVAKSPFSLEGKTIRMKFDRCEPQEVEKGVYQVTFRNDAESGSVSATMTADEVDAARAWEPNDPLPLSVFVIVTKPARYGTEVKVLGNTCRLDGMKAVPSIFWKPAPP